MLLKGCYEYHQVPGAAARHRPAAGWRRRTARARQGSVSTIWSWPPPAATPFFISDVILEL